MTIAQTIYLDVMMHVIEGSMPNYKPHLTDEFTSDCNALAVSLTQRILNTVADLGIAASAPPHPDTTLIHPKPDPEQ